MAQSVCSTVSQLHHRKDQINFISTVFTQIKINAANGFAVTSTT